MKAPDKVGPDGVLDFGDSGLEAVDQIASEIVYQRLSSAAKNYIGTPVSPQLIAALRADLENVLAGAVREGLLQPRRA